MRHQRKNRTFSTLLEFINASETREDDEEFKNAVDELFERAGSRKSRTLCSKAISQVQACCRVLYALKDFLIKRLGSLLEHTT